MAERGGRCVGHVFFSPVSIAGPAAAPPAGGLAPVGVLPEAQGAGVGGALIHAGIEAAHSLGWELLFVLGEPAYYARFGFERAAPHGLHYESHAYDAAFQVQELAPGALGRASGWVHYHPAFTELAS